jgi:hypothetical protein
MEGMAEQNIAECALLDLAIEGWRFQKLFARALEKMELTESARFANQHRYFVRRIEDCLQSAGLRLVSLEGHVYDAGAAAAALNIGDFGPNDVLVVDQMVEPIVMNNAGLVRSGTVMLRKADQ